MIDAGGRGLGAAPTGVRGLGAAPTVVRCNI
jgi:hypothetical protein